MSQRTRRNFIGTGLGGALALLATKGFAATDVKSQNGSQVLITGLTSTSGSMRHVHGFEATLDLSTGEFSGTTTTTIGVEGSEPPPHTHDIASAVEPFDFEAEVETGVTSFHTHLARPN